MKFHLQISFKLLLLCSTLKYYTRILLIKVDLKLYQDKVIMIKGKSNETLFHVEQLVKLEMYIFT